MAGRRAYTRELYTLLLKGFREAPANASAAARYAGCDPRTARRVWRDGWPALPWARPIKDVIAKEETVERERKATILQEKVDAEQAAREKARAEVEAARGAESRMLQLARQNVLGALAVSAKLTPAMAKLADLVVTEADSIKSPDRALSLLNKHSSLMQRAANAADSIVKLSRLDRGETTEHLSLSAAEQEMSYEEALQELESAGELRQMLEAKHGIIEAQVVEGPLPAPQAHTTADETRQ
jgi:hypothetical protein